LGSLRPLKGPSISIEGRKNSERVDYGNRKKNFIDRFHIKDGGYQLKVRNSCDGTKRRLVAYSPHFSKSECGAENSENPLKKRPLLGVLRLVAAFQH
jgi:hypothetical protein